MLDIFEVFIDKLKVLSEKKEEDFDYGECPEEFVCGIMYGLMSVYLRELSSRIL